MVSSGLRGVSVVSRWFFGGDSVVFRSLVSWWFLGGVVGLCRVLLVVPQWSLPGVSAVSRSCLGGFLAVGRGVAVVSYWWCRRGGFSVVSSFVSGFWVVPLFNLFLIAYCMAWRQMGIFLQKK